MAEVVLRDQVSKAGLGKHVVVDSAGTGDWHVGDRMYARARAQLARSGYDGEVRRARQFDPSWLPERDLILAMDAANLRDLRAQAPAEEAERIRLFGEIAGPRRPGRTRPVRRLGRGFRGRPGPTRIRDGSPSRPAEPYNRPPSSAGPGDQPQTALIDRQKQT